MLVILQGFGLQMSVIIPRNLQAFTLNDSMKAFVGLRTMLFLQTTAWVEESSVLARSTAACAKGPLWGTVGRRGRRAAGKEHRSLYLRGAPPLLKVLCTKIQSCCYGFGHEP